MVISLELKAKKKYLVKESKNLLWVPFWNNRLHLLTKHAKSFVEGKKWVKNVIFSRCVESGGGGTSNRFVSMIRSSKHFWGTCFHPNILMSSHLLNWRKNKFLKFWHFSFFWPFLRIFSLLKIAVNLKNLTFVGFIFKTKYFHD